MRWEVDVHLRDAGGDHAARAVVAGAAELGIAGCTAARTAAAWLVEGALSRAQDARLAPAGPPEPPPETDVVAEAGSATLPPAAEGRGPAASLPLVLHVFPRSGVTDP
ncbi:MAG: hypothetical protein ACKOTB_16495, partial [Planctomycetia bacterium]